MQREGRRAVYHDLFGALGHPHLPGTRRARIVLEGGDAGDDRLGRLALTQPASRRALGVAIDQQSVVATPGEVRREIDRERRLAGAPFGVEDDDSLHGPFRLVCQNVVVM